MEQTAVGLAIELIKKDYQVNGRLRLAYVMQVLEQAKEMEKQLAQEYAEFAIRCDREDIKILDFDGYINIKNK